MVAATFRLGSQTVRLQYANPGADPVRAEIPVPEISFRSVVPAGAELLDPYIAGRSLRLMLDVEGDTEALVAGDALVLRYTAELDGLPAMFLPPLSPGLRYEGASVYADEPEVEDGDIARRSETLTLVFEAGGEFGVPEIELKYWNTASGSVETVTTPALSFTVAGPVAPPPVTPATMSGLRWSAVALFLASLALAAFVVIHLVRSVGPRVREAAGRRRASEKYAFRELDRALHSGKPDIAYRWLLEWLQRLGPGMSTISFARSYGDESLLPGLDALSGHLFGNRGQTVECHRLAAALRDARRRFLAATSPRQRQTLPSMNP
jgi:hypothetical protein